MSPFVNKRRHVPVCISQGIPRIRVFPEGEGRKFKITKLIIYCLPCVPGIVALIPKNIEPLIIFLFLLSLYEPLKLGIYQKIKPRAHFSGVLSFFPACFRVRFFYFIRVTFLGTLCIINMKKLLFRPMNFMLYNWYKILTLLIRTLL